MGGGRGVGGMCGGEGEGEGGGVVFDGHTYSFTARLCCLGRGGCAGVGAGSSTTALCDTSSAF